MSLLREIQNDLARSESDISSVLLKCKILASRLSSSELAEWADWELNGYMAERAVPDYRRLAITYYASFINIAWRVDKAPIPLQLVPQEHRSTFREIEFREGIAKAASLAKGKGSAVVHRPELVFVLQGTMYPQMDCHSVWGEIPRLEFEQLIAAVRTRILDFVLKIEEKNPAAGEAPPNTVPVPTDEVRSLVQNFFYAAVGAVAQNSPHVSQTVTMNLSDSDLKRLVTDLTAHLKELQLEKQQNARAEAQISIIRAELSDKPDYAVIVQAGRTLRNITEGAIASLLAAAAQPNVWHWIHQALSAFR
jgi:hypothetical protein